MLADSLIKTDCIYTPGSFTGLMTLYESSYLKLLSLGAVAEIKPGKYRSVVADDCDLHLEIIAREPYTTTISMTYLFPDESGLDEADPGLLLRIYHDARLAEAVSLAPRHRHEALRRFAALHAHELDRRWQRNMTLNKWLDYLIDKGHKVR